MQHEGNLPHNTPCPIDSIISWFQRAIPEPELQNLSVQIGAHYAAVADMVRPMKDVASNQETMDQLGFFADVMDHAAKRFKTPPKSFQIELQYLDRLALIDALCNQIVTAIGVAHMCHMDIAGALQEVAISNDSKLDEAGRPIFSSSMNLLKGPNYNPPNLSRYI